MSKSFEKIGAYKIMGVSFDVYGEKDNPFFKAMDICDFLGDQKFNGNYTNMTQFINRINESERIKAFYYDGRSPVPSWFVTKQGFLELIFSSRKKKALKFKSSIIDLLVNDPLMDIIIQNNTIISAADAL